MHSFCEEDYVVTIYLAEFINSLTNLMYSMSTRGLAPEPGAASSWGQRFSYGH
jgi:hypothetical protein